MIPQLVHRSVPIIKLCRLFCGYSAEFSPLAKARPCKGRDGNKKYDCNDADYRIDFCPCAPRKLTVRAVLNWPENEMFTFVAFKVHDSYCLWPSIHNVYAHDNLLDCSPCMTVFTQFEDSWALNQERWPLVALVLEDLEASGPRHSCFIHILSFHFFVCPLVQAHLLIWVCEEVEGATRICFAVLFDVLAFKNPSTSCDHREARE